MSDAYELNDYKEAFDGKAKDKPADTGYGLDPNKGAMDEMAAVFDGEAATEAPKPAAPADDMDFAEPDQDAAAAAAFREKPAAAASDAPPEFKTFGQAFKWHRQQAMNGGPKTFEWNGKQFTTKLNSEVVRAAKTEPAAAKAAKAMPAAPAAPAGKSLAQSKAAEFAAAEQAAKQSGSHADRLASGQALRVAEDAAAAERAGKSAVIKRERQSISAAVDQATVPNSATDQYATGEPRYFKK